MKKQFLVLLAAVGMMACLSGCVSTVDGHMRAGVPGLKDTIESHYERSIAQIFPAAREVLARNGTLQQEDVVSNALVAKVDTRTVYVRLYEINPKVTRVITQVRNRNGGTDLDLASEIDKQIALQLVTR